MTAGDCIKALGLEGRTYDTALPQTWVDQMVVRTGFGFDQIVRSLVWYCGDGGVFGRPLAIVKQGNEVIAAVNRAMGSSYPLTSFPNDWWELAENELAIWVLGTSPDTGSLAKYGQYGGQGEPHRDWHSARHCAKYILGCYPGSRVYLQTVLKDGDVRIDEYTLPQGEED